MVDIFDNKHQDKHCIIHLLIVFHGHFCQRVLRAGKLWKHGPKIKMLQFGKH